MSGIVSRSDGDVIFADDVNQYGDTFNAVLGVTDTAQDALGRLVIPSGTAFPGAPSAGMLFMRTDLGAHGRVYFYHPTGGAWKAYLPLLQHQETSYLTSPVNITSTSFADVSGLSIASFVTTGGKLRIYLKQSDTEPSLLGQYVLIASSTATGAIGYVRAVVGGVNLSAHIIGTTQSVIQSVYYPPHSFFWEYQPAAGTYTVKIQAQASTANNTVGFFGHANGGIVMVVEEYAD